MPGAAGSKGVPPASLPMSQYLRECTPGGAGSSPGALREGGEGKERIKTHNRRHDWGLYLIESSWRWPRLVSTMRRRKSTVSAVRCGAVRQGGRVREAAALLAVPADQPQRCAQRRASLLATESRCVEPHDGARQ